MTGFLGVIAFVPEGAGRHTAEIVVISRADTVARMLDEFSLPMVRSSKFNDYAARFAVAARAQVYGVADWPIICSQPRRHLRSQC